MALRPLTRALGAALLAAALLAACSHPPAPPAPRPPAAARLHLVWPPPPARPRITYLRDVVLPRDRRPPRGLWHRIGRLFGKRVPPRIVRPYGVAVADDGTLIVADPGAFRVHLLNLETGAYRYLPDRRDHLTLLSPIGVAVDADGTLYVTDSAAAKVYTFGPDGRLRHTLTAFHRPTGIALDRKRRRLYVVDTGDHRVRVFSTAGEHLFDFGWRGREPGAFNYPTNICLDGEGHLYVVDAMNFRVQRFDADGHPLGAFGRAHDGPGGFSKPRGIAVDSEGHVYVADATFDNVQIFDPEGQVLLYFGATGRSAGHFYLPAGVAIDARDRIYVADSYNRRIQIFQYLRDRVAGAQPAARSREARP